MASKKNKTKTAKLYNTKGDLIARVEMVDRPTQIRFQGGVFMQDLKKKKRFKLVANEEPSALEVGSAAREHSAHA